MRSLIALSCLSIVLSLPSCHAEEPYSTVENQDYFRNQFRIALNGPGGYNSRLVSFRNPGNDDVFRDDLEYFHYNRGPLTYLLAKNQPFVNKKPTEKKDYVGIYLPPKKIELAKPYLPANNLFDGYFDKDDSYVDFRYVVALGKYEYESAFNGETKNEDYNAFDDAVFLKFDNKDAIPSQYREFSLCGLIQRTKARLEDFNKAQIGEDYYYSFLQGKIQEGKLTQIEEIDSEICSANKNPLLSSFSDTMGQIYLTSDTNLPFVEALFSPRRWLGGHCEIQHYGLCDDTYLYYPVCPAEEGDTSLSNEELYFISGNYFEEATRQSIVEIKNVIDQVHSFSYSKVYMKVATIDYRYLMQQIGMANLPN